MGTSLPSVAVSQPPQVITSTELSNDAVTPKVWYYADNTYTLDLTGAQELFAKGKFIRTDADFNFGYSEDLYWVTFAFSISESSASENRKDIALIFDYPHLDDIQIFRSEDGKPPTHWLTLGDRYPFDDRPVKSRAFVAPETIHVNTPYRYWIRIDTKSSTQLHPAIWDKERFLEKELNQTVMYGMFYGILLVMALYNMFIGYSIKDKAYGYYVAYIFSFLLLQCSINGDAFKYLWPTIPWINTYAIPVSVFLSIAFSSAFSRNFLQLEKHFEKLNITLAALSTTSLLCISLFLFFEYQTVIYIAISLALINTILILTAATFSLAHGFRYAKLFLIAWVTLLISAVITALTPAGFFPSNWFTRHSSQFGSTLEVVLLSLALAHRINRIKAEARSIELRSKLLLEKKNVELRQALKLITKNNNLKDSFLATISHELRTPMNGIEGSLQVIRDEIKDKEIRNHVDDAANSAIHMTQLVDSLLEYSELQSGNWKLQESPFELETTLSKIIPVIKNECKRKGISFSLTQNIELNHLLIGDAPRINHILFQLLDNAVKFTHQGGIVLDASSREDRDHYTLYFSVSDSGIGIKDQQLSEIFDGFNQIDASFSRQYGGLGLGLSLCKAIIDRMGGDITISSAPEKGTNANISIQLKKGVERPLEKPTKQQETLPGNPIVLIVEDNPVNQVMLSAIIKKFGCTADQANNGEEAVRMAKERHYDCILMDCQMPILDGFEATKSIRSNGCKNKNTPIIAVTANAMSGDRERCIRAGMNDYIRKPIKKDIVFEHMHYWLSKELESDNSTI